MRGLAGHLAGERLRDAGHIALRQGCCPRGQHARARARGRARKWRQSKSGRIIEAAGTLTLTHPSVAIHHARRVDLVLRECRGQTSGRRNRRNRLLRVCTGHTGDDKGNGEAQPHSVPPTIRRTEYRAGPRAINSQTYSGPRGRSPWSHFADFEKEGRAASGAEALADARDRHCEPLPAVRRGNVVDMLRSLTLPVLVTHGAEDKNTNLIAAEYTAKMIPGAKLSVYQGIGHSPFFKDAPRFNAELAAFVRSADRRPP